MADAVDVRKLDAPGKRRHAADDLAVDEVADAPAAEDERCGDGQGVEDRTEWLPTNQAEEQDACEAADDQPVGREAPNPECRYQGEMFFVVRPLVTEHDEAAPSDQHARGEEERKLVDVGEGQAKPAAMTPEREVRVDEA